MKFCSNCDTKLTQNSADVGGPGICPKCNPEKIIPRKPTYGVNYSGRTKQCSKGCGSEIYWDEEFKSDRKNLFHLMQEQMNHIIVMVL